MSPSNRPLCSQIFVPSLASHARSSASVQHIHMKPYHHFGLLNIKKKLKTIPISCCSLDERSNMNLAFVGGLTCGFRMLKADERFRKMIKKIKTKH